MLTSARTIVQNRWKIGAGRVSDYLMQAEQYRRQRRVFPPAFLAFVAATVLLRVGLSFTLPRTIKDDEPVYLLLGYNRL